MHLNRRRSFFTRLLAACLVSAAARAAAQSPSRTVKDFGAVGDGVHDDLAAVRAAFKAGKTVRFSAGTYFLGRVSAQRSVIELSDFGDGITILTEGVVELVVETTENVMPRIFNLQGNSDFRCGPIRFRDRGYSPTATWRGAVGFCLHSAPGRSWGRVQIDSVHADSMVAAVMCLGDVHPLHRVRGVSIDEVIATNCYYGVNCQNQGDGLVLPRLRTDRCVRPYFVYGVTDHDVRIDSRSNLSSTGSVNISRSPGGLDTKRLKVAYLNRNTTAPGVTHVNINHIDLLGGVISQIQVVLDVQSTVPYTPVTFINYSGSGGKPVDAPSRNEVRDVTIEGRCEGPAEPIEARASYASRHRLGLRGRGLVAAPSLVRAFAVE